MSTTSQGQSLPVMETFYTIQGEGFHAGVPAYFIRLGGCDVGCVWCDVKDSWDASRHPLQDVQEIAREAAASGAKVCVVTGGEPAMYDLTLLTEALQGHGLRTHIETSGVYPLTGRWDWVTFSPKKFKAPHDSIYPRADELKIIVFHLSDLTWAEEHAAKVSSTCHLFLQAEWDKKEKSYPLILSYIAAHTRWRLSVQVHKYLGVD